MRDTVRLGLYEKAMPGGLSVRDKLEMAHACGFDWMEISIDETEERRRRLFDPTMVADIRRAMQETGMRIDTVCLSAHRRFPLGEEDPMNLEIFRRAVDLSAALGIRLIQLAGYDTYYHTSDHETRTRFGENLAIGVEYAAARGVALGFETMETDFMNTTEKAMYWVTRIASPYLGVYPDIGNITNATSDALRDLERGKGHIFAAHLKETKPGVYRDLEYGQGHVDFPGCIRTLYGLGVRMFTCEFWYDGHSSPQEYVERNAVYVKRIFAGT